MRIAIDIRKYHDFGIGTYIRNLVRNIVGTGGHEFIFIASAGMQAELQNELPGTFVTDDSGKYSVRELFSVSRTVNTLDVDLFHAPHYTLPFFLRAASVVTIHDLIHLRMRQYFSPVQRLYARTIIGHACRSADAVIVDSEFTKQDILSDLPIDAKRIHPIHLGVDAPFFEPLPEERREKFKNRVGISRPYVLYTGSLKPHKNFRMLLESFATLRRSFDVLLVVTGERISMYPELAGKVKELGLERSVRDVGRLKSDELRCAYQSAEAVVLPSLYEGFGLSMIEAMASGVPAIGANAASIPEVVGEAGLLIDPHDPMSLADAMGRVLGNADVKRGLVKMGQERAKKFTWEECARKTIEVYAKVTS